MTADMILVGAFAGAHGVRGDVRVKSFCAQPEDIGDYGPLSGADGTPFLLTVLRTAKSSLIARVEGVRTKDAADALRGTQLFVPRDRLPALPDDEFYHSDLIGLTVLDTGGTELGRVKAVLNHGAADLLEIHRPGASKTVLLPFTRVVVPTVDLTAGRIIADPPDGLV